MKTAYIIERQRGDTVNKLTQAGREAHQFHVFGRG